MCLASLPLSLSLSLSIHYLSSSFISITLFPFPFFCSSPFLINDIMISRTPLYFPRTGFFPSPPVSFQQHQPYDFPQHQQFSPQFSATLRLFRSSPQHSSAPDPAGARKCCVEVRRAADNRHVLRRTAENMSKNHM